MKKINWDYLAGFTDGEGYLGIIKNRPRICWGQKDKAQIEVIKKFLEGEGYNPSFSCRNPRPEKGQPNRIYVLVLSRRDEVARIIEILEPKLVLKSQACHLIRKCLKENPPRINTDPVNYDIFNDLYSQGYIQGEIAKRMNYSVSTIRKFAKKNGFNFPSGGRVVDGKRHPKMSKEEYKQHKRNKSRTKKCPDCGVLIYKTSKRCKDCANKNRPKCKKQALIEVSCTNCKKKIQRPKSQLDHYPTPFCSHHCHVTYKQHEWSKNHAYCIDCGKTDYSHVAKGRCKSCHNKWYRKKRLNKQ